VEDEEAQMLNLWGLARLKNRCWSENAGSKRTINFFTELFIIF